MSKLKSILIDEIAQNEVALRNVDRQSEGFIQLRDSIAKEGIINAISVRESPDGSEKKYELIDGLHRFMAAAEAGLKEMPAQILTRTDAQVLESQLIANAHVVKTKPVEFARQIQKILSGKPTLTISQLASDLSMSPTWISERLGLLRLNAKIAELVDKDKITLTNAFILAKFPEEEQANFVQAATTQPPSEFVPYATGRLKEIREAARSGRQVGKVEFEAQPRPRKRSELLNEYDKPTMIPAIIRESKTTDPIKAARLAIEWVLQMDTTSVQASKAKFDQQKKEMEAAKVQRKAKRDAEKAKESADVAAKVAE